jgi:hypothetical protein
MVGDLGDQFARELRFDRDADPGSGRDAGSPELGRRERQDVDDPVHEQRAESRVGHGQVQDVRPERRHHRQAAVRILERLCEVADEPVALDLVLDLQEQLLERVDHQGQTPTLRQDAQDRAEHVEVIAAQLRLQVRERRVVGSPEQCRLELREGVRARSHGSDPPARGTLRRGVAERGHEPRPDHARLPAAAGADDRHQGGGRRPFQELLHELSASEEVVRVVLVEGIQALIGVLTWRRGPSHRDGPRRRQQRRVLLQDAPVQRFELGPWVGTEFVGEQSPPLLEHRQGLRRLPQPVQRHHQQAPQPLAQRMIGHQRAQLPDQPCRLTGGECRSEVVLGDRELEFVPPGRVGAQCALVGELAPRGSTPQAQGLGEDRGRRGRVGLGQAPALRSEAFELDRVDLVRNRLEQVAVPRPDDGAIIQDLPQSRHVHLQRLPRRRWRLVTPDALDQGVHRDRLLGVQQQQRQHHALSVTAQMGTTSVGDGHLQRAQHAEPDG